MSFFEILGQTTLPATQPGPPPPGWFQFLQGSGPIILIVILFYFLFIRPKSSKDKQRQNMLSQLKKGDRVQTIGGILGTVVEARDSDVLLKVDESSNTKIRFARNAIHRVVDEEKSDSK